MTYLLEAAIFCGVILYLLRQNAAERRQLLDRIAGTSLATWEPSPGYVPFDDDSAFHAAVEERG